MKLQKKKKILLKVDFFESLTEITNDNIKDWYTSSTLFMFIVKVKKVNELIGHFNIMPQFIRGSSYPCFVYMDNKVLSIGMTPKKSESDEDYRHRVDDSKSIIKEYIKKGQLYGKKID